MVDCTNPALKDMIAEDSTYRPYEVRLDPNRDGHEDAAIALVRGDSGKIYYVPARQGGYDEPQLLGTLDWIREGGLVARDSILVFGRFYSDVSVTWVWRPTARRLELLAPDLPVKP